MKCFLPSAMVYNHFNRLRLELRFISFVIIAGQGDNNLVVMLVGNKTDLDHLRAVPTEKGMELAEREGMYFMETSALDSTNVDDAFESVIAEIYNNVSKRIPSAGNQTLTVNPPCQPGSAWDVLGLLLQPIDQRFGDR